MMPRFGPKWKSRVCSFKVLLTLAHKRIVRQEERQDLLDPLRYMSRQRSYLNVIIGVVENLIGAWLEREATLHHAVKVGPIAEK